MTIATTAAEAFRLYQQALAADALIQRRWHQESEGRQLACGLGVLGAELTYADAVANADAYPYANAYANANAYAYAYAYAYANADAYADAEAVAYAVAIKRLADGLVDCLSRVPSVEQGSAS